MNIQSEKQPLTNEIILYSTPEGDKKVGVLYHDENFWLTQKAIAQLFNVEVPAISKHLANIYDSGELEREATVSILETVRREGIRDVKRKLEYYNLDAIISFLALSNYPILRDKGKVIALETKLKAEQEYETYREKQDREYISDFDREIKRIQGAQEEGDE